MMLGVLIFQVVAILTWLAIPLLYVTYLKRREKAVFFLLTFYYHLANIDVRLIVALTYIGDIIAYEHGRLK